MVGVIVGLKLLHVVAGMWLVAGLAGRTLALAAARHSQDIGVVAEVSRLGGRFDRFLVIPGAQAVLITGLLTAWLGGYRFSASCRARTRIGCCFPFFSMRRSRPWCRPSFCRPERSSTRPCSKRSPSGRSRRASPPPFTINALHGRIAQSW